jgi:hypothetical protein
VTVLIVVDVRVNFGTSFFSGFMMAPLITSLILRLCVANCLRFFGVFLSFFFVLLIALTLVEDFALNLFSFFTDNAFPF